MIIETRILSGVKVSSYVYAALEERISNLKKLGTVPSLAVILVGHDPASKVYVRSKTRKFKALYLNSETFNYPDHLSQAELIQIIQKLNHNNDFHGILVQLPLPPHINSDKIIETIAPHKDVDGFHPYNLGKLTSGKPNFIPCTPKGIMRIMEYYKIDPSSKHVVVIGRSNIVGRPISILTSLKKTFSNATTTLCHSGTQNISFFTRQADIIILAMGNPEFLSRNYIKKGAVIFDVGINRVEDDSEKGYSLVGDANVSSLMGKAGALTPVPGGVGPMTIAMLVENTVEAAENYFN